MEKYGFVYLWRDRKHKRYYIGSHWGTEDDGYICSSQWMQRSYARRPQDFKRRILSRTDNRQILMMIEFFWISYVKSHELKVRYYNLRTKFGHWHTEGKYDSIRAKISANTKKAMQDPQIRANYEAGLQNRNVRSSDPEVIEKKRKSMKATMAKKFPLEQRPGYGATKMGTPEYLTKMGAEVKKAYAEMPEEKKLERGQKISAGLTASKEKRSQHVSSLRWWNNGCLNRRCKESPGPEWSSGRFKKN